MTEQHMMNQSRTTHTRLPKQPIPMEHACPVPRHGRTRRTPCGGLIPPRLVLLYCRMAVLLALLAGALRPTAAIARTTHGLAADTIPAIPLQPATPAADTIPAIPLHPDTPAADTIPAIPLQPATPAADTILNEAVADTVLLDTTGIALQADTVLQRLPRATQRFVPNPQRALWLSLIIPGAGQIYNRKLWKIPIVYGGFLGCLYALTWNNQMYNDYSQAYLDIMDDDPNTKSYMNMLPLNYNIEGREQQFKDIFKNKKNYYRKYRDMSIFAMIGVYLLSVVDAYVDAELSSFDISKNLGLTIEPAILEPRTRHRDASVGLQCKISF